MRWLNGSDNIESPSCSPFKTDLSYRFTWIIRQRAPFVKSYLEILIALPVCRLYNGNVLQGRLQSVSGYKRRRANSVLRSFYKSDWGPGVKSLVGIRRCRNSLAQKSAGVSEFSSSDEKRENPRQGFSLHYAVTSLTPPETDKTSSNWSPARSKEWGDLAPAAAPRSAAGTRRHPMPPNGASAGTGRRS